MVFLNNKRLLIFLKNHVVLYMLVDTWHILNKEDLGNQIYLKSRDFILKNRGFVNFSLCAKFNRFFIILVGRPDSPVYTWS